MTDGASTSVWAPESPEPALPVPRPSTAVAATAPADRPELAIAGAFAGGFLLAFILKRLARH